ncbi:MAG: LOG family protein [Desulfopila sp.]
MGCFVSFAGLFKALTCIQPQRLERFPIVFTGSDFWAGLVDWINDRLLSSGTVRCEDVALFQALDDTDGV